MTQTTATATKQTQTTSKQREKGRNARQAEEAQGAEGKEKNTQAGRPGQELHGQPERGQNGPRRQRQRTKEAPLLSDIDIKLLTMIGEEGCATLDELATYSNRSYTTTRWRRSRWERAALVSSRKLDAERRPYVWLTDHGLKLCGLPFAYWEPSVEAVRHISAKVQARTRLRSVWPNAMWTSERYLRMGELDDLTQTKRPYRPDAVVTVESEHGPQHWGVEAELWSKRKDRLKGIVKKHLDAFYGVVYFANPEPYALLERMKAKERWPKDRVIVSRLEDLEPRGGSRRREI